MNRDPPKGYNKNWLSVILLRFRLPVCQRTFYEYTMTSVEISVTFLKRNVKIRAFLISTQLLVNIFSLFSTSRLSPDELALGDGFLHGVRLMIFAYF
tara:strand:- start:759 stop:1049 length:291 start_codon:yes stop_codon:yes gene_type:complete